MENMTEMQNDEIKEAEVENTANEGTGEEKPKIIMPENPLFETKVQMTTSVLYDYMLRHTYSSLMGIISTVLGLLAVFFFFKGAGAIYLIIGGFVLIYIPWNLFLGAKRQILTNEAFKKPLQYAFSEEGVYVQSGEQVDMQRWEHMYQAISTGKSIVLYTSKVNACIFPRKDLGDETAVLIEVICKHMDPKKVKIKQ